MDVVIGVDEVGRGAWAGPLLVVAARLTGTLPDGLRDSKLLNKKQRNSIFNLLSSNFQFGEGWVQAHEIDDLGLTNAMRLGVERALLMIEAQHTDQIIIDGAINYCGDKFPRAQAIVRADNLHPIVSAASIYGKVLRDRHMAELGGQYPEYGFESHVGYGTVRHSQALKRFGVTSLHRRSYKPVQVVIAQ